ncbi:hypothetical protein BJV77DRAFT_1092545, partial [Russula vinacea]
MAASPSKIKSLEKGRSSPILHSPLRNVPLQPSAQAAARVPSPAPPLRRQRSIVEFRDSPDGTRVTAKFDIPGVEKEDMNVTYHLSRPAGNQLDDRRGHGERRRRVHDSPRRENCLSDHPIPEGTRDVSSQFDEIDAKLHRRLEVTYPKVRAPRARPR